MRWMMAAAVFAVIGHIFTVWLEFRGGKGVATALGAFLAVCPEAVAAGAVLWHDCCILLALSIARFDCRGSRAAVFVEIAFTLPATRRLCM